MNPLLFLGIIVLILLILRWVVRMGQGTPKQSRLRTEHLPDVAIRVTMSDDFTVGRSAELSPAQKLEQSEETWIPPGVEVSIGGLGITGGMIYVGSALAPVSGWDRFDPALINPSLKIGPGSADVGQGMDYWPSYGRIPSDCRKAYLSWLAKGRCKPDAYIGYVFLFFYGLERRLLFDLRSDPAEGEAEARILIKELKRLLSIYDKNGSFHGYASSLLGTVQSIWEEQAPSESHSAGRSYTSELPKWLRVGLGRMVKEGRPIPPEWAFSWAMSHPETTLRTPARRCEKEFKALFTLRYGQRFGEGMRLKPNKRSLVLEHLPASQTFSGPVKVPVDLPDVAARSKPIRALWEILESSTSDLDAYSRYIGRNPEEAESLAALALLPPDLVATTDNPELDRLKAWVESAIQGGEQILVRGEQMINQWSCDREDRIGKRELGSLARVMGNLGYGLEPDPRFGGGTIKGPDQAVIFRFGAERVAAVTSEYRAATLLLRLAAAVATSDGVVTDEEHRLLADHLERSMKFGDAEIRRLRAHLQWLLVSKSSLSGIGRRLDEIDIAGKRSLATFAVAIAGADGTIDPKEVRTITKIYSILGLGKEQAYADIHSYQVDGSRQPAKEPVTVRPAVPVEEGFRIPAHLSSEPLQADTGFHLDMARVEKTLADTAAVSSVLAKIFQEQEPSIPAGTLDVLAPDPNDGLDTAHGSLFLALKGCRELSREEFERMADDLGLLPDGAIETMNEYAFEKVERPLLEGTDPIEVDAEAYAELER